MFVSACSLRSTQCAALIALATVAGIARVETTTTTRGSDVTNHDAVATHLLTAGTTRSIFTFPRLQASPWLQPMATVALWLLSSQDRSIANLTAVATTPASGQSVTAEAPAAGPLLPLPVTAASIPSFSREPRAAVCTLSHLIPFAVGPPRGGISFTPFATGTLVHGNSLANRQSARPSPAHFRVAHVDDDSSQARLARPSVPSPSRVGLRLDLRLALRGEPSLSAVRFSAPTLCHAPAATAPTLRRPLSV